MAATNTKAHRAEIEEGPAAFERFRNAMKTIVGVPKHVVVQADRKAQKKKRVRKSS